MNAIIKWTLYTAMLVITLASALSMASAATFTDSFNVSGDGNWSLDATFTEDLIEGSIGPNTASGASIYQNFTLTENMNFNESITITADTYTLPGSNVHYNVIGFIKEGAWNSQANGVFFWPTYDIDDDNNNHEMRIACLGECSCTLVDYNNTLTNDGFYSSTINIDLLTGNVTMTRNDSAQLSTIVSGCNFQDYYLNLFFRSSYDVTEFWDFSITDNNLVCTPDWTCSGYGNCMSNSTKVCDEVIDVNACGDSYTGDYSEFDVLPCGYCVSPTYIYQNSSFTLPGDSAQSESDLNINVSNMSIDNWKIEADLVMNGGSAGIGFSDGAENNWVNFVYYEWSDLFSQYTLDAEFPNITGTTYLDYNWTNPTYNLEVIYNQTDNMTYHYINGELFVVETRGQYITEENGIFNLYLYQYDQSGFSNVEISTCEAACTPNWTCSGYAACNTSDLQACNAVTDQNACGDTYSGDYSEFNATACDYCTPDWSCIGYGICLINDTRLCNETNDSNSCFAQTGLPSDQYNGTYTEFNVTACDYCTPSWTCIGYAACAVNDTRTCNSTNDTNSCYATTGLVSDQYSGTYTEFNTTLCDYCLPNWSCSLFGACNISNLKPCLSTADSNVCYSLTGLPSDQFNESLSAYEGVCVYTPPQTGGGGAYSTYVAPLATRAADVTSQTVTTTTGWWDGLPDKEKQIYILIFSGFAIAFLLRGKIL